MTVNYQVEDISFTPFQKEIAGYSPDTLRQDLLAAFSVALLTIPQAMGYALLAGLPLSCGLFAAIFSAFVAASMGSSRHLVVGPSNSMAILVQAATSEILFAYYRHLTGAERDMMAIQILSQLVFLTAFLQILAAFFKLGRLTQFVSHSVIVGYIAGTAMAIVINQSFSFFGIERMAGNPSFYERTLYLFTHWQQIHLPTAAVGVGSLILILIVKRIDKRLPAGVLAFFVAALAVYWLDLSAYGADSGLINPYEGEGVSKVLLVGELGGTTDLSLHLEFPYFDTGIMNELLPVAFALALLSIMESTAVAKSIAACSGQRLSTNQEIFGVGIGNMISAFVGAMPVSGSSSRSSLNFKSGGQTRFAAIFSATFVGLLLYSFSFLINHIPLAAMAALLLVSSLSIVNPKQFFLCLKATRSDGFVLWVTFLSCFFFSLNVAFYIGVAMSIIFYLNKAAEPHLVEYDIDDAGELVNIHPGYAQEHKSIRVIKVEGELFFGAADLFQTTLKAFAEDDTSTKVIILQLKNARDIDATVCLALQQLHDYLQGSGRHLIACGITAPVWEVLSDAGIVEQIGKDNLFLFDAHHPHAHMQRAIQRAKLLSVAEKPAQIALEGNLQPA